MDHIDFDRFCDQEHWQHYHQCLYQASLADFNQVLTETKRNWPAINLDAALGIFRIYTRTGCIS